MALSAVLHSLCVFGLFQKGLTGLIGTQRTVMAAVGGEAGFSCQLLQIKDVVQVAWNKVLPEGEVTLASYTTRYGERVNPAFKDKIGFTDAGLQSSSIFIRNVTEEDEGCYLCLFNADPEGSLTGTTCLHVYELHGPVLHVGASGSEETVVSCSATGRPAPTVTLTVRRGDGHFPGNSSVSVNNTNGTVTVTSTAVLTRLHDMDTEVRCAVRVLSAAQKEEVRIIPAEVKQSAEGFHEDSGIEITHITIITTLSVVLVFCCVAAAVITVLLIRRQRNSRRQRDSEEFKMSPKRTEHTQETNTPDNENLRKRTPPEKREGSESIEPSPETRRKLF